MPRPIPLKQVLKVLQAKGFVFISQKGSHAKFRQVGNPTRTVIVKMGKKKYHMELSNQFYFFPDLKKATLEIKQKLL